MASWAGDNMEDTTIRQYSDVDLASDLRTHRSTSASHRVLWCFGHHARELTRAWLLVGKLAYPIARLRQK
eukprot:6444091-Pyramimonas_sp.AAC.1